MDVRCDSPVAQLYLNKPARIFVMTSSWERNWRWGERCIRKRDSASTLRGTVWRGRTARKSTFLGLADGNGNPDTWLHVAVDRGRARLLVRRETQEDLQSRDVGPR